MWLIGAASLFYLALALSYMFDIAVNWSYYGFGYDPNPMRIALGFLTLMAFAILTRASNDVVSFYQGFIVLAALCPAAIIFGLGGASAEYFLAVTMGTLGLFIFSRLNFKRFVLARLSRHSFIILLAFLTSICILTIIAYGGLRYFNLNPWAVYLYRTSAAELLPPIFGHITSPVSKVIIPIGVVLGVYYRSRIVIVTFILLTIIFYGLTQHKTVIVAPVAVLIFYYALLRFPMQKALSILFLAIGSVTLVELFWRQSMDLTSSGMFSSMFTRRVFMLPPLLDSVFVDFFKENEFYYWATSRITFNLVETSYEQTAPFVIGSIYFGNDAMSANSGFVGSGFANAGTVGVVIYGVVLGLILSVLNAHGRHLGHAFTSCAAMMVVVSAINSSDLVTVLLTHGMIFLLLLLSLMPSSPRESHLPWST